MSLFLSRLLLNLRSRRVISEMAHPYEMHRTLMNAFSQVPVKEGENAREKFGVLFRADVDHMRNLVTVYVQSKIEPDWSYLAAFNDYLQLNTHHSNPACKDISMAYQRLKNRQVLSFRLLANPTKRIGKSAEANSDLKGKRVGLLREEEQIEWLIRKGKEREKGEPGGFEIIMKEIEDEYGEIKLVPRVEVRVLGKQRNRKKLDGNLYDTTHLAVQFDGLLRVKDATAFRETLIRGIGPAKAFGFGLLSVAPIRSGWS